MNKMNVSVACAAALLAVQSAAVAQTRNVSPIQSGLASLELKAEPTAGQFAKVKTASGTGANADKSNPGDRFAAADASAEVAVTGSDAVIPAVFDGDRVRTRMQFTNIDTTSSIVTLTFADPDGYGKRFDIADVGYFSTVKITLNAKGSREVVTSAIGEFKAGWAMFTTSGGRVLAQSTIEQMDSNGVWQASSTPAAHFFARQVTLRFDHTRGWDTQLIMVNCNSSLSNPVTVTVRNQNGLIIDTFKFTLDTLSMGAFNSLRDRIGSGFTAGTVEIYVPNAVRGGIAAIAFRYNDSGAFETVTPQSISSWVY